jgi:hypothetical protein
MGMAAVQEILAVPHAKAALAACQGRFPLDSADIAFPEYG